MFIIASVLVIKNIGAESYTELLESIVIVELWQLNVLVQESASPDLD
jgi:hypothetical protein